MNKEQLQSRVYITKKNSKAVRNLARPSGDISVDSSGIDNNISQAEPSVAGPGAPILGSENSELSSSAPRVNSPEMPAIGEAGAIHEATSLGASDYDAVSSASLSPIEPEQPAETKVIGGQRKPPVTMESFITQAYMRKGQRVGMNEKLEKSLSTHHRIDEGAMARLLNLAQEDRFYLASRQLLLAALAIESHPIPRNVLVGFIRRTMLGQPIYKSEICQQALEASADVPDIYHVFQSILSFGSVAPPNKETLSPVELESLRLNALKLMAVWLFHSKGVRLEAISAAWLDLIWKPAATELALDAQRARALTDISEHAAVGWLLERYLNTASEAQRLEERARNEALVLKADLDRSRCELEAATASANSLQLDLERLKKATDTALSELTRNNNQTRTHLSHDIELMRGRIIDNLNQNVELLETGLTALKREVPRVAVMIERAEIVIKNLKVELIELGEGN